jgi:hypothetical protein
MGRPMSLEQAARAVLHRQENGPAEQDTGPARAKISLPKVKFLEGPGPEAYDDPSYRRS